MGIVVYIVRRPLRLIWAFVIKFHAILEFHNTTDILSTYSTTNFIYTLFQTTVYVLHLLFMFKKNYIERKKPEIKR